MNKVMVTAVSVLALMATPAFAADVLDYVAPEVIVEDTPDWSGFYLGVHGGYGMGTRDGCWSIFDIADCDEGDYDEDFFYEQEGGLLGAQAGVNFVLGDHFVVGAEVDASLTGMTGTLEDIDGGEGTWNWLATGTLKAGLAFDRFMVYGEGGVALANHSFDGVLGCDFDMTHQGWVAGGGAAVKVTDNVSVDLSYQHVWLDSQVANCLTNLVVVELPTQVDTRAEMDIVKLGVNVHL